MFATHNNFLGASLSLLLICSCFLALTELRAQDKSAEIKNLRQQQKALLDDTLKEMSAFLKEVGPKNRYQLLKEMEQIYRTKLKLAENSKERLAILKETSVFAEKVATESEDQLAGGVGLKYRALQAKAYALEVRMQILMEEEKALKEVKKKQGKKNE